MKKLAFLLFLLAGNMGNAFLHAQPGNDEIALNLLLSTLDARPDIGEINAFFNLPGTEHISLPDSGAAVMSLSPPVITYQRRADKLFDRKVEMSATIASGDQATREVMTYQDSITYRQMRKLIRKSDKQFRGEDPTFRGKWLIPMVVIVGGTGIPFALFYLRSQ